MPSRRLNNGLTAPENRSVRRMMKDGLGWEDIAAHFPCLDRLEVKQLVLLGTLDETKPAKVKMLCQ